MGSVSLAKCSTHLIATEHGSSAACAPVPGCSLGSTLSVTWRFPPGKRPSIPELPEHDATNPSSAKLSHDTFAISRSAPRRGNYSIRHTTLLCPIAGLPGERILALQDIPFELD